MLDLSAIGNRSLTGRLLRAPLQLIPKKATMPILQGPLRGTRWIVGSGNHGYWLGSYEVAKQAVFAQCVKSGDVIYDVGANAGYYSLLAAKLAGPAGLVFAFEPVPRNLTFLVRHLAINNVHNCRVVEAAAGGIDGVSGFEMSNGWSMGRISNLETPLSVKTVRLDTLLANGRITPPRIIKMDIEGGEYEALQGAPMILEEHRPLILLATHGAEVQKCCRQLLEQSDYECRPLDGLPLEDSSELIATPRI